jgi:uncharacterized tellurite resistance protein B-like protein
MLTEYFGEAPNLTPRIALASAIIYMINADGKIEPEEIGRLVTAVRNDRELLEVATRYTKFHSADDFLVQASEMLNRDQKLSVLVNLYDAILANGQPVPQEVDLFERFMSSFGYQHEEFQPFFTSIAVKNNRDLFSH